MKTKRSLQTVPALMAVAFLAFGLLVPSTASAKDHWNNNRGYQKHGYNVPPGQYKKYYGSKYNHNRYYYQPRYETYQGRRGYWQENNGLRIFINL